MFGKSKGIIAVLAGVMSLCLLSACAADEKGTDKESPQETASAEHGFHSESLPSGTDVAELPPNEEEIPSGDEIPSGEEILSGENMPSGDGMPSGMEEKYKAVLLENADIIQVYKIERSIKIDDIDNIWAPISSDGQVPAKVTQFTILDLDGDGEDEIVLWIVANGNSDWGFEVLFYRDQKVYGVTLPYREFNGLKTDGTFTHSSSEADSSVGRLQLFKDGYTVEEVSRLGETDVKWYDLTPENVEIALSSEENMPSGMKEKYKAILLGEAFISKVYRGKSTKNVENIKEVVSSSDWVTAEVTKFTILDLDGDGEDEIVLWIVANGNSDWGFEVLFYRDQEVYGVALWYRAFMDLKTDGTFEGSGGAGHGSIGRLQLSKDGYTVEKVSRLGETDVEWYDFTPESVELAFENRF